MITESISLFIIVKFGFYNTKTKPRSFSSYFISGPYQFIIGMFEAITGKCVKPIIGNLYILTKKKSRKTKINGIRNLQ